LSIEGTAEVKGEGTRRDAQWIIYNTSACMYRTKRTSMLAIHASNGVHRPSQVSSYRQIVDLTAHTARPGLRGAYRVDLMWEFSRVFTIGL
jgi:hypothetical protein